ncbi:MAG: Unknown protein [uncultured Aureispira sp.]|uniref:DUF3108 domain-containing protein n=1 Tax=uncultured Aureispira sp. TaxID=1331704 RepID=A0A6S6T6U7_9BACT|nr:MAG: Unknown protein [uncultured Aureispira sp.]
MTKLLYLIVLLFTASSAFAQKTDTLYHFFKGSVNKEYSITMELKQSGATLTGAYFYDKYRKSVAIEGELREGNLIVLREVSAISNQNPSIFVGTYSANWKSITGTWENILKNRRYIFNLKAIQRPIGQAIPYRFDNIRRFQEFLNYFDLEPALPFVVHEGIQQKGFRWKSGVKESSKEDYKKIIPYRLAKRYIMNQVLLRPEGSFNYYDIKSKHYKPNEMHYTALCCVYRMPTYVGVLVNFEADTGWDRYDVTFLLTYDYAGHLLDACKVGKSLDLEYNGRQLKEKMTSHFLVDSTIEMRSSRSVVEYGTGKTEEEYYKEGATKQRIYYILQPSGRFIRQEVVLKKSQ